MTTYLIGTGIADVTDPAIGNGMQGMADPSQKITGVESRLYARAFIVADQQSKKRVVILNADLWTGTGAVKAEVIKRLQVSYKTVYDENNVLVSGTHTHSGPGGYSDYKLFEHAVGGFDKHTFECVVSGMVRAIQNAHTNLAPGKIYINKGPVSGCGSQRSAPAYENNPLSERNKYGSATDKEMLLLKFVTLDRKGELPIGTLNWYAIHPTDRGQKNTLITGDNKGYASELFEKERGTDYAAQETFVAAFANSNSGDVSGNVDFGMVPDGKKDKEHMQDHGKTQFDAAKKLFNAAREELIGPVDYRHTRVDMSNVKIEGQSGKRTWPGGLGLAFAAGSTEDSVPRIGIGPVTMDSFHLKEGLVEGHISVSERAAQGVIIGGLAATFGTTSNSKEFVDAHLPKPLVLAPGLTKPPVVPSVLPLQIIRIGNLVLTAVPAELTTMAGRRLKETVLNELMSAGVNHLALATYANDYSQYITTKEEYDKQHYEGASTLYGPYTLMAYQQEFRKLATALKNGTTVSAGPSPASRTADTQKRITIRNKSSSIVTLKLYKQNDALMLVPFDTVKIPRHSDKVYALPGDVSEAKARINDGKKVERIKNDQLVTISGSLTGSVSSYSPPHAALKKISTIGRS